MAQGPAGMDTVPPNPQIQDIIHYSAADAFLLDGLSSFSSTPSTLGHEIVEVALHEVGRGPELVGKDISFYPFDLGRYLGNNEAWCSEFVSWCYKVAGYLLSGGYAQDGWMLKNSFQLQQWFQEKRDFIERTNPEWFSFQPVAGDYVRYIFENGGHSGIVRYVSGDTLYTVEGNVSNSVKLRNRPNWRLDSDIHGIGLRVVEVEAYFGYETYPDNLKVSFTDQSFSRNHNIKGWEWDFGDNQTSDKRNPVHEYVTPGEYRVQLKVITGHSTSVSDSLSLDVTVPKPAYESDSFVGYSEVFSGIAASPKRQAMAFTMPEDGKLMSLGMYHEGGRGKMLLAVYEGKEVPGNLIGITPMTSVNNNPGWQTISLIEEVVVPKGDTIWLAWVYEDNPGVHYRISESQMVESDQSWEEGMPESFGNCLLKDSIFSICAGYRPVSTLIKNNIPDRKKIVFHKVFPNPFNDKALIVFELSEKSRLQLDVYDIHGQRINTIVPYRSHLAGRYMYTWDGTNARGAKVSSGIYLIRLQSKFDHSLEKVIFLK